MYYPSSIKDDYRLARVVETFPDMKGLVRSVRVCYRKRNKREKVTEYKAKPMTEEIVAVQRLSLLLPASEQKSQAEANSPASCMSSQEYLTSEQVKITIDSFVNQSEVFPSHSSLRLFVCAVGLVSVLSQVCE